MEILLCFEFKGKKRTALTYVSLEEDGCFVFALLKEEDLIREYGSELDFETDCENVIRNRITNKDYNNLQEAILNAVKQSPEFILEKAMLQGKRRKA